MAQCDTAYDREPDPSSPEGTRGRAIHLEERIEQPLARARVIPQAWTGIGHTDFEMSGSQAAGSHTHRSPCRSEFRRVVEQLIDSSPNALRVATPAHRAAARQVGHQVDAAFIEDGAGPGDARARHLAQIVVAVGKPHATGLDTGDV